MRMEKMHKASNHKNRIEENKLNKLNNNLPVSLNTSIHLA